MSCQPDDRGLIGDVPVLRVTRRGPEAVHFVPAALEPGTEVLLSLDWERRFDHMQQHSGPCPYRGAPGDAPRWVPVVRPWAGGAVPTPVRVG